MSTEEGNKKLGWVVALLAVAVLVLGGLLYLRSEEKNTLELEKQALTIELSDMKADLLSQMGANDSLNGFIQYETQRLGALIDSINTVNVQNKKQLTAYRSRIAGMKKQNDALVAQLALKQCPHTPPDIFVPHFLWKLVRYHSSRNKGPFDYEQTPTYWGKDCQDANVKQKKYDPKQLINPI